MADTQPPQDWITTEKAIVISKEYLDEAYNNEYLRQLLRTENSPIRSQKFGRQWAISEISWREYLQTVKSSSDKRHGAKRKTTKRLKKKT
jgi:hypothetical protein